jgi:drug/metabolite transporter (DMT)-like permease
MVSEKAGTPTTFSWIILTVLAIMWGSSFILIKRGLDSFDPGTVAALRITSASLFLSFVAIRKIKLVKGRHIWKLITVGFVGSFIPAFLYAKAQTQIDSGVAGVLNAVTPLWVIIIGIVAFRQKITLRIFLGMFIGFAGTVWLVLAGSGGNMLVNYYALFIIVATICYGINLNLIKFKLADLDAFTITSVSLAFVGPLAIAFLFLQTDFMIVLGDDPGAWWSFGAVCLLGIMGTAIALVIFNKLVQVTNPVFASSVTYLIPIVAVIWGILDGEKLLAGQFAGMLLILAGVFIANRKK